LRYSNIPPSILSKIEYDILVNITMKVVCLGLDPKTLDPESVVAFRNRAYGEQVEHYTVVVPSVSTMTVKLSHKTTIFGIGAFHKGAQLFMMWRKLEALIREKMCDVITAQDMYFLGLLGLYAARRHHRGLEVQVLGIEKLTPLRKRIAVFVLKRASVVRALSERLKQRLIHEFGIPRDKIRVVTIYVDVRKLGLDVRTLQGSDARDFEVLTNEFRERYGTTFNFLTVCRLVPIKRIELQLSALRALVDEGAKVMLHIVGTGPDEVVLKNKVTELGLDRHVVFHGYKTGMALGLFYLECDCFLLTSDYEGWGMVIIEAATAGLPIIMTDVGCAGELIHHEVSGLVVAPGNSEALHDAMGRMVREPALREQLSVGATEAIQRLPSFEVVLQAYKAHWELADAHRL
jgi:glycosyltransferase involved in cell wall biosynthesis